VNGRFEWVELVFRQLDELQECLLQRDGSGGPLHVLLDGNLRDRNVLACSRDVERIPLGGSCVVRLMSVEVVRLLSLLTEPQRLVWFHSRRLKSLGQSPSAWGACLADDSVDWEARREDGPYGATVTRLGQVLFPGIFELQRSLSGEAVWGPTSDETKSTGEPR